MVTALVASVLAGRCRHKLTMTGSGHLLLLLLSLLVALAPQGPHNGSAKGELVINVGVSEAPNLDEVGLEDENGVSSESVRVAIFKQAVSGNSSTDTVTIEYTEPDGTRVTQLTDFRMHTQVTRVILVGEEELNEPAYQVLCFVSAFTGDLIPPEAVMKLRQKHPGTVRVAETDEGNVVQDCPLLVLNHLAIKKAVSSHLPSLCKEAKRQTFTSSHEMHSIVQHSQRSSGQDGDIDSMTEEAHPGYPEGLERCGALSSLKGQACQCTMAVDFYWYPCALKYCRNQDSDGEHRCGIRTCKKTMTFRYPAKSKLHCLWDEA